MNEASRFNGVDGSTGSYLPAPRSFDELAELALGSRPDEELAARLRGRHERDRRGPFGPIDEANAQDLASAGWGVVFARGVAPEVREALAPLLDHRRVLTSGPAAEGRRRFYQFQGPSGYHPGESTRGFLRDRGAAEVGAVDPDRFPYYVLLVGDPTEIPFRFQYELDIEHAVGRIHFDGVESYANYARSVVASETTGPPSRRELTFFGVQNVDDGATKLAVEHLVNPLAAKLAGQFPDWSVRSIVADEATKGRLGRLLGGPEAPALLFTSSHGMGFRAGDPRQLPHQGALLCREWPGPKASPTADHYFSGDDVDAAGGMAGRMTFHFACYAAGTPDVADFPTNDPPPRRPFLACLPRRLLGLSNGGALAVIGHVERAWTYSFLDGALINPETGTFRQVLARLLRGERVGWALESINKRYSTLATLQSQAIQDALIRGERDPRKLGGFWLESNDARNYLLLGDPAVRLNPAAPAASTTAVPLS